MLISIIAAIGENRELGKDNRLLWHIPEDLVRFKKITQNHPVIMGHTTFHSIGKPLPNRTNIVISRNQNVEIKGCIVTHSLSGAIEIATSACHSRDPSADGGNLKYDEIFIIGGGQIYQQAITRTDKLYLTIVKGKFTADTFFPDYSEFKKIVKKEELKTPTFQLIFLELKKE